MTWTKCSDKMPPPYEDVLGYAENGFSIQVAWLPRWKKWEYCKGMVNVFDYKIDCLSDVTITHWMPLAEEPNVKACDNDNGTIGVETIKQKLDNK